MYQLTDSKDFIRLVNNDGTTSLVPRGSRLWPDFEKWLAAGNVPDPEQSAAETKASKWEAIKTERDRRTENGGYKVDNKWFHSDQKSRSQQQDNEAEGASLVHLAWKTMDGSFIEMTPELAAQIRIARMASDRAIFAAAETHHAALVASANPESYDFSAGWPDSFAGGVHG